jgi:phosphoribosylamine---glycine ligase
LLAAAQGALAAEAPPRLKSGSAVHVVMTSEGYPETFGTGMRLGEEISLSADMLAGGSNDNALLFIAGARKAGDTWQNTGGRVLGVTATGPSVEEARAKAYDALRKIHFNGAHWRSDIGR